MEGELSLIVEATRDASRFLLRDYFELGNLQTSNHTNILKFGEKACLNTSRILDERLTRYFNSVVFAPLEMSNLNVNGKTILVETMNGFSNFTRAMPFFAIIITIISNKTGKIVPEAAIMNFPALGEIYYAEKGKGAWIERYNSNLPPLSRLRVSAIDNVNDAIVSTNINLLPINDNTINNFRLFDSSAYSLARLISGNVDIMIAQSELCLPGLELFIEESGGIYSKQNNKIIASNSKLHEKIKHLF